MIAVSFLKSKLSKEETIAKINASSANLIHVDLMDGLYVSEKNFPDDTTFQALKNTTKLLDIHLMVQNPLKYLEDLSKLNVWCITFHLDSTKNPLEVINYLNNTQIKVGIAINPQDDIHIIDKYLELINYVLIMSVTPGKGGQKFMKEVLSKVKYLQDKNILIGIDGGINAETIKLLKDYQIDNIVSGSFVCLADDYEKQINILRKNGES